ncbi:MAG: hypothetical protein COA50_05910 [Flavobacteriaceae bacterium]|nr:MAG: hypothetical protein COA50_05910 [Flavobacteriaceae bacterium]
MKLAEALDVFKNLIQKADTKSELKIYQGFINVLSNLKSRTLTEEQVKSIELKLSTLNLMDDSDNKKKYFSKKLNEFTTYLRTEFSFVTAGYYAGVGMIWGMVFGPGLGLTFGTAFGGGTGMAIGLSMGAGIGMVFGMMFGAVKDLEAKKQNRVLG